MKIRNVSKRDLIASTPSRGYIIVPVGQEKDVPQGFAERWIAIRQAVQVVDSAAVVPAPTVIPDPEPTKLEPVYQSSRQEPARRRPSSRDTVYEPEDLGDDD